MVFSASVKVLARWQRMKYVLMAREYQLLSQRYILDTGNIYSRRGYRKKKWTSSKFPGFPILSNVSPIFHNASPISYWQKCSRFASANVAVVWIRACIGSKMFSIYQRKFLPWAWLDSFFGKPIRYFLIHIKIVQKIIWWCRMLLCHESHIMFLFMLVNDQFEYLFIYLSQQGRI